MFYLILSILSSTAMALLLKSFREQHGNRFGLVFGNYVACVLIAFFMTPQRGALLSGSRVSLLCGLGGGFLFVAGLLSTQTSIRANGVTLTTAFSKLGLLVTLGVSVLCFGERPGAAQLAGIVLVLAALLLIHGGEGGGAVRSFPLLLLTLLAVGSADSMAKVFEELGPAEENALFFLYLFLTACLLSGLLCLIEYRRSGQRLLLREMGEGALVAVPNYFCSWFLLRALMQLPAILVYPVFSVGTILLVMLAGALLFREKLGRRQLAGMLVILAALTLLNL